MASRKMIGAAALTGALALGGITGAVLGVPNVSGAQDATTTTTAPAGQTPAGRPDGPGQGMRGGPDLDGAAKVLGVSVDDLKTELQGGKTLADVAKEKGIDKQKLIDALVADATTKLDQQKADLPDRIAKLVDGQLPVGGPDGHGGPGGRGDAGKNLATAAKTLGVTEDDLRTAMKDGKSLADVAKDKGVDEQKLIDALVADAKTQIATEVTEGHLTQAKADERIADLPARIKDRVEHAGAPDGPGRRGGHGRPGEGRPDAPAAPGDTATPTTGG